MLRGTVKAHKKYDVKGDSESTQKGDTLIQFLKVDSPKASNVALHSRQHTATACTQDLLFQTYKVTETYKVLQIIHNFVSSDQG
jgi:hypothetical protein